MSPHHWPQASASNAVVPLQQKFDHPKFAPNTAYPVGSLGYMSGLVLVEKHSGRPVADSDLKSLKSPPPRVGLFVRAKGLLTGRPVDSYTDPTRPLNPSRGFGPGPVTEAFQSPAGRQEAPPSGTWAQPAPAAGGLAAPSVGLGRRPQPAPGRGVGPPLNLAPRELRRLGSGGGGGRVDLE
eukprot:747969-Prorocentrum_minimum.AAC.1